MKTRQINLAEEIFSDWFVHAESRISVLPLGFKSSVKLEI